MSRRTGAIIPWIWIVIWFAAAALAQASDSGYVLSRSLRGIEWAHPLGFDTFGRDLLLTVLKGSLISAAFAAIAVVSSCALGVFAGSSLALAPARARFYGLRALETLLAFPGLLFALAWAAIRGPGWGTLTFSLLIGMVPSLTRLLYARTRELMAEEYVLAAQSLGASPARVIAHHVAPSLLSLCTVKAPNLFAHALLAEATLSFLGVGAPIGHDTWGSLLSQGKEYLIEAPHIAFGSGIPLVLTVLALQFALPPSPIKPYTDH